MLRPSVEAVGKCGQFRVVCLSPDVLAHVRDALAQVVPEIAEAAVQRLTHHAGEDLHLRTGILRRLRVGGALWLRLARRVLTLCPVLGLKLEGLEQCDHLRQPTPHVVNLGQQLRVFPLHIPERCEYMLRILHRDVLGLYQPLLEVALEFAQGRRIAAAPPTAFLAGGVAQRHEALLPLSFLVPEELHCLPQLLPHGLLHALDHAPESPHLLAEVDVSEGLQGHRPLVFHQ
mmetsp:Transcript_102213/g.288768  ORF Transcript_102213/g.288768 Transcript_102213/m.288768 type:complete len:231 (+) Transcript_102213:364-1056(+)